MKCKKLMVGDLVSYNGTIMQIIFVGNGYATYEDDEGNPYHLDDSHYPPEPIPLTPEILEKNGWKHSNRLMITRIDGIDFYWSEGLHVLYKNRYNMCDCKYVHELQHALRLCGLDELADNFKI